MVRTSTLLALAALGAGPGELKAPKKWERLADAPARPDLLLARGGYACWVERRLVPGTENERARSFVFTLHRWKDGADRAEKLHAHTSTGSLAALLGPGGELATGHFGNFDTLYVPGQPGVRLPPGPRYQALRFVPDGLLCFAYRYVSRGKNDGGYEGSILLFPVRGGKAEVDRPRVLRPWFATDYNRISGDFLHADVFLSGDYLVHRGFRPRPGKAGSGVSTTLVWDVKNGRVAWEAEDLGAPSGIDDRYVYFLGRGEVARRPLAGDGAAERSSLPELEVEFDFQPPKLFALARRDEGWTAVRLDVNTGERTEYALEGPRRRPIAGGARAGNLHRPFWVYTDPLNAHVAGNSMPVGGDAKTGELRAAWGGALYRIPATRTVKATERRAWAPLPGAGGP